MCGYAEVYTQGLEYSLINGGEEYKVTGIGTAEGAIVVPRSYEGKPVTKIADYAFMSEGSVTEVVIPDSVIEIGSYT